MTADVRVFYTPYHGPPNRYHLLDFASPEENLVEIGASAEHITFSWWGGFWLRNTDGSVNHGTKDQPLAFANHTKSLPLGYRSYQYVFFGNRDLYLFRYTNGNCGWGGTSMPKRLEDECKEMTRDGYIFGKNTALCHYDPNYYFIHWVKGTHGTYTWNVPEDGKLNNALVTDVVAGKGRNLQLENTFNESVKVGFSLPTINRTLKLIC
jgi:hypothetical protein